MVNERKSTMLPLGLNAVLEFTVSDIQCAFQSHGSSNIDTITAVLRKPAGFRGTPLFADDRSVNPSTDRQCIIEPDPTDELVFHMTILDFSRCGVLKRNVYSCWCVCELCLISDYVARDSFMSESGFHNSRALWCSPIRSWSSCANRRNRRSFRTRQLGSRAACE